MTATTPAAARQVLDRAMVDAVLVCTDAVEGAFYGSTSGAFHTRLVDGDAPAWLREVPVSGARPRFRLYEVANGVPAQERIERRRVSTVPTPTG